jgi:hypothetical protein
MNMSGVKGIGMNLKRKTIPTVLIKKMSTSLVRILANRFAMVVNECAEAVRPFAKGSKESMLGFGVDIVEKWRCEHVVMLVHKPLLVVVVHIDKAVGFFPNGIAVGVFSSSIVREFFDVLEDDFIDEFALVGEKMLDAVVFGGDKSFRPIYIDGFVVADEYGVEVVIVDDTLLADHGVVEAMLVLVFDLGVVGLQDPLGCGVD